LLALRPMPDIAIRIPFFEAEGSLPYFERPRLRPARIRFIVHGMLSHVVRFNWGNLPSSSATLNAVMVDPPTSP
jgi:hypothetical protein